MNKKYDFKRLCVFLHVFSHWILDESPYYQNPINVTMNSYHSLQAVFTYDGPSTVELTVQGRGFGYEEVETDVYIDGQWRGTTDTIIDVIPGDHTIEVDDYVDGWSFYYYDVNGDYDDYDNPTEITVSSAMTVTAEYVTG